MNGSFVVPIPASPKDNSGHPMVTETVIGLPIQGGGGGVTMVWAIITAAAAGMRCPYAHWRVANGDGTTHLVPLFSDGATIAPWGYSRGNNQAPPGAVSLIIDSVSELGGSVNIEYR